MSGRYSLLLFTRIGVATESHPKMHLKFLRLFIAAELIANNKTTRGCTPVPVDYFSSITDKILPAGSLNQAIFIPGPVAMPLRSVLRSGNS